MLKYLAGLCIFFCSSAFACMSEAYSDAENFAGADYVFLGHVSRLEEMEREPALAKGAASMFDVNATFRVIESLKGDAPRTGVIASSSASCFVPLIPGDYVFFAKRDENGQMTALTMPEGTRWFSAKSDQSISYLNALKGLSSNGAVQKP